MPSTRLSLRTLRTKDVDFVVTISFPLFRAIPHLLKVNIFSLPKTVNQLIPVAVRPNA
jgi:hypothetical protein